MKFKDFLKEKITTITIPTKILGFKEDYLIVYIDNTIEIFNSSGDFISLTSKSEGHLFNALKSILKKSDTISYDEYKDKYSKDHKKFYNKNDWDADEVIVKASGIDKLIPMIKV